MREGKRRTLVSLGLTTYLLWVEVLVRSLQKLVYIYPIKWRPGTKVIVTFQSCFVIG